jgi:hypothetical protein
MLRKPSTNQEPRCLPRSCQHICSVVTRRAFRLAPSARKTAYSLTSLTFPCNRPSTHPTAASAIDTMTNESSTPGENRTGSDDDVNDDVTLRQSSRPDSVEGSAKERSIKRRAHRKSRYGCKNCKTRRIKVSSVTWRSVRAADLFVFSAMKANQSVQTAEADKFVATIFPLN